MRTKILKRRAAACLAALIMLYAFSSCSKGNDAEEGLNSSKTS